MAMLIMIVEVSPVSNNYDSLSHLYMCIYNNHCFISSEIIDSPDSMAVKVNSNVTFTCKGNGSHIIWQINSEIVTDDDNGAGTTLHTMQYAGCTVKQNMTVYASLERNNSKIICSIRLNGIVPESEPANLIVIGKCW